MFILASIAFQSVTYLVPFLLWPSRKNLHFILFFPIFLIAHLLGPWVYEREAQESFGVSTSSIEEYTLMLIVGLICTLPAIYLGFYVKSDATTFFKNLGQAFWPRINNLATVYGTALSLFTVVLFTFSYVAIGFVPLFTENPQAARFFADEYEAPYRPYAAIFRLSLILSQLSILVLGLKAIYRKQLSALDIVLFISLIVLLVLSVRRGLIFGILTLVGLGFIAIRQKQWFWPTIFVYTLGVGVGSTFFSLLLIFVFPDRAESLDLLALIVSGLPDVRDSLWFMDSWLKGGWDLTYGLSVVGGLVPQQYPYNLRILSKLVVGAAANAATGGFRLDTTIQGYIAFSWLGVILFSTINGFLTGVVLRAYKSIVSPIENVAEFIIWTFIFRQLFEIVNFVTNMQLDSLVTLVIVYLFFVGTRVKV